MLMLSAPIFAESRFGSLLDERGFWHRRVGLTASPAADMAWNHHADYRPWMFWIFPASSKSFFVSPPALCVDRSIVTLLYELDQSG
jgi:hypothetical protein